MIPDTSTCLHQWPALSQKNQKTDCCLGISDWLLMKPQHALRLGVALNYSVFLHDVAKVPRVACQVAQRAVDDTIVTRADDWDEQALVVLALVEDNLSMWQQSDD